MDWTQTFGEFEWGIELDVGVDCDVVKPVDQMG